MDILRFSPPFLPLHWQCYPPPKRRRHLEQFPLLVSSLAVAASWTTVSTNNFSRGGAKSSAAVEFFAPLLTPCSPPPRRRHHLNFPLKSVTKSSAAVEFFVTLLLPSRRRRHLLLGHLPQSSTNKLTYANNRWTGIPSPSYKIARQLTGVSGHRSRIHI